MPEFKVEGTYRHDRGHEHGESKPIKFGFTVLVANKIEARRAAELEIIKADPRFDSIREFTAVELFPVAPQEPADTDVETPAETLE